MTGGGIATARRPRYRGTAAYRAVARRETRGARPASPGSARTPLENFIVSTSIKYSQASKSQRWMPWRQMPKKDVDGCDKPRGAAYQASIRGCPNGETRLGSCPVTPT